MKPDNSRWIILGVVGGVIGLLLGPLLGRSMSGGGLLVATIVFLLAVGGFVAWSLSRNRIGRAASAAVQASARNLTPAAGMARIYVVRRGFMGGVAGMKVAIAGVASGQIRMNHFVMAEVRPGTYTVETAMAREGTKSSKAETVVSLGPGDVVVIRAMLQMEALHSQTTQERLLGADAQREIASAAMREWTDAPAAARA